MNQKPEISVVLGSYNRLSFLKLTIESIRKELDKFSHEIIVVDGGSNDGSLKWLSKQKDIITIIQHNRGQWCGNKIERKSWGYFMNLAFKAAQGKYVCMLSDDCLVVPGAIRNAYELFERKLLEGEKVGLAAFYWRNWPEEKNYYVCTTFGRNILVNHGLMLKAALEEVNYIDENHYNFYHADDDLALRIAEKGYKCIISENSYIEHFLHANTGLRAENSKVEQSDLEKLIERWGNKPGYSTDGSIHGRIEKSYIDPYRTFSLFLMPRVLDLCVELPKIISKFIILKVLKILH